MEEYWITPDLLFISGCLRSHQALRIENNQIMEIISTFDLGANIDPIAICGIITPGFIDLQVNGGGDILFNQHPNLDSISTMIAAHRKYGTMAIMPTVITDAPDVMKFAAQAAIQAKSLPGFVGLHIEGPHISEARRGTHDAKFIRPLDQQTIEVVDQLIKAEITTMITLAPEAATAEQIHNLNQMGVIVSLGHTDAQSDDMVQAFAAGAKCVTHLFNAMSPMLNRSPNAVGASINSDAYAGIICDGHHVADEMIALAHRARPIKERMFLVSDAMPTVGGSDQFELYEQIITLKDGKLINQEGSLAGAHTTMAEGVNRLHQQVGLSAQDALKMAVTIPAELIGALEYTHVVHKNIDEMIVLDNCLHYQRTLAQTLTPSSVKRPIPN